jgi:hypothetical protein
MHTLQHLNDPADVSATFAHHPLRVIIRSVTWRGREYVIQEVSYTYCVRKGRTLLHVFWAVAEGITFKLVLSTESLAWTIQEIHDHEPDSPPLQHQDEFDPPY